jgi:hypothetical protein
LLIPKYLTWYIIFSTENIALEKDLKPMIKQVAKVLNVLEESGKVWDELKK